MSALDQSFADLCEKHDLDCIGVNYHRSHEGTHFSIYVHSGKICASGIADDIAAALSLAIASINEKRCNQLEGFPDEALPELAA